MSTQRSLQRRAECFHDAFQRHAVDNPQACALRLREAQMTYRELDFCSNKLANYLQTKGVGPEVKVAFSVPKSMEAIIAFLAIMKAGGCVVPLDTQLPQERWSQQVQKAEVKIILTFHEQLERMKEAKCLNSVETLLIDPEALRSLDASNEPLLLSATHENAAFVIFTSGSTGAPKGVVIEHGSVSTALLESGQASKSNSRSRWLHAASYAFDVAFMELFYALGFGGCLCILEEHRRANIAEDMEAMGVTHFFSTPTVAKLIRPEDVPSLCTLILGGEPIPRSLYQLWASKVNLVQSYGPTEGAWCAVREGISSTDNPSNIGRAFSCCELWITNPDDPMHPLPDGDIGEIIIRGPLVARQYIGEEKMTAAKFIPAPSWLDARSTCKAGTNERVYRSGDLGYKLSNGEIMFMGRRDTQVKIHGQRIELAEIEHQLRNCPNVSDAVVVVKSQNTKNPFLVAFVLIREKAKVPEDTTNSTDHPSLINAPGEMVNFPEIYQNIKDRLSRWMPAVMVPNVVVPINYIPQSATGKIDRNLLIDTLGHLSINEYRQSYLNIEPSNGHSVTDPREYLIRAMWSEVLDRPAEEISASDDFFELGGSSLTAIQFVSVARARGIAMTMDGLLRHSQLSSLAEKSVDTQTSNDNAPTEQPFPLPAGFEDLVASRFPSLKFEKIYPINFAQMATLLQGPSWPEAYHIHLIIEVHGPSDADLLQKACQDLVDHYATLRSIFHMEGENCVQLVAHPQQIPASLQVFESLDEARDFWNRHEADFLDRPLTHFGFVRAGPDVSLISIGLHHVQMDEWMISQVLLDLASAYLRHPMRPQTSFIAYAQEVDRRDNDEAASHWRALLQGSKLTGLSNVQDAPANGADGSDRTLFRRIHRTSSLRRTTFGDLLHAAWGLAMAQVSKCLDIVFITVTSGRSIAFTGVETVMGPCPNVIPIRASFKPGQRYIEVLEAYKGQNIASSAYETTPFTSVCTKSTDWPFPPTVGAMVNHTQVRGNIFEKHPVNDSTGMTWRPLPSVEQKGRCDAVHVYLLSKLEGESVGLSLQFNPNVVTEERAEQLMECLCLNIDRICHGPEDEIDLNGCC